MTREIYMDHSATTALSQRALAEMLPYFTEHYGNPSSIHEPGIRAKKALENSRARVAKAIGAANVHNDYLQFLCEHGIVGLGCLVAIFFCLIVPIFRDWGRLYRAARFLSPEVIISRLFPEVTMFVLLQVQKSLARGLYSSATVEKSGSSTEKSKSSSFSKRSCTGPWRRLNILPFL